MFIIIKNTQSVRMNNAVRTVRKNNQALCHGYEIISTRNSLTITIFDLFIKNVAYNSLNSEIDENPPHSGPEVTNIYSQTKVDFSTLIFQKN